ncbi:MAG: hypothetical protein MAG431_01739 [Chloroflexi bacterium]|nr:hypothetical protein [Chloroflexota bacterium]
MTIQFKDSNYESPGVSGKSGFEDLACYKLALNVVINAHELARNLPPEEKYDLAQQIRKSSKSVTANIAEGYGRYHYKDSLRYLSIARGELNETLAHFNNALALNYIQQAYHRKIHGLIRKTEVALNGFMSYIRKQEKGKDTSKSKNIREEFAAYHAYTSND